ncbi:MAG: deacetylase [Chthoniobacteraceae bacterium]|nr:deacetylase [Chthoniobacteraceae bacterium]
MSILSALVVSLHDVSPRTRLDCTAILAALKEAGVPACSLLVIPDHHRRGHLLDDADFCQWLRGLANEGHEVVIHGYHHWRERRPAERLLQKFLTRLYTADEGEFYDLSQAEAARLVSKAREEFRLLGLDPAGFIAPAWLLGAEAEAALCELGIQYTTRLATVSDFRAAPFQSQSLVWSVRSLWRRVVSLGWNLLLFRLLKTNALMRISIHPVDCRHPRVWRQIRGLTVRALTTRVPLTYLQWIGQRYAYSAKSD